MSLLTKLLDTFKAYAAENAAFKNEPRVPVPSLVATYTPPVAIIGSEFNGYVATDIDVMQKRLAGATASAVGVSDILSEAEIKAALSRDVTMRDRYDRSRARELINMFKVAGEGKTPFADVQLTQIKLGADPYHGKDFVGGTVFTTLEPDEVQNMIKASQRNGAPSLTHI